jgi:cytidylate kinase
LGYDSISREILLASAKKYNIDVETLEAELTDTPSFWQRLTREHHRYLVFARCALLQAALEDNLVYHGHAGQFFLNDIKHVLKVRIEAPLELRVHAVMEERGLDHARAVNHIQKVDEQRRRWVKLLYDKNWSDPSLYDLTINLAHLSLDAACEIVCAAAQHEDLQATEESRAKLRDQALECEVNAGIAADDKLHDQNITVVATKGNVVIRGNVKTEQQRQLIEDLVAKVKGVEKYEIFVSLLSDPLPRESKVSD